MNNYFFTRFALSNLKKNHQIYVPYIISCIATISMFFIMQSLAGSEEIKKTSGGADFILILSFAGYVIGIFSLILLFYTNSFLMKRRKKEIGLYHILGMEKRHIAIVMLFETLFILIGTLVAGIAIGLILEKLMFLILMKLMFFHVSAINIFSIKAIIKTVILFTVIFLLILSSNFWQIKKTKPIELLTADRQGEREPKSKFIITCIGIVALVAGYGIALTVKSPLQALYLFFIAILLVMLGTYLLFISGSIIVLKLLRKNKAYYYKTKNFISVSSMIYRMKQNAAGLASICILSTAVILTISTTVSMYCGVDDVLHYRFPHEMQVTTTNTTKEQQQSIVNAIKEKYKTYALKTKNEYYFTYGYSYGKINGNQIKITNSFSYNSSYKNQVYIEMIPLEEYNRLTNKHISLGENEILLHHIDAKNTKTTNLNHLIMNGSDLKKVGDCKDFPVIDTSYADYYTSYYIVMADSSKILQYSNLSNNGALSTLLFDYYADFQGNHNNVADLKKDLKEHMLNTYQATIHSREDEKAQFYAVYGTLFFIGIFLGALFLGATALIIYYKQISEGFDDRNRYAIMQKVGLSKKEIKKSIQSQIIKVFFLPIVVSVVHIIFAFRIMLKLLALLGLTNILLFIICTAGTIVIFLVFYMFVYISTAKTYYKIVYEEK